MRVFVTGATGFIGGRLARALRARGDEVVALVRSPERARDLESLGVVLVGGDLGDAASIERALDGCDSAFHVAAVYKVGVTSDECRAMHESNVGGTERVLDAAIAARVSRIVYVSTVNYFGNTHGRVLDETDERPVLEFVSCYDETKYRAHEVARQRIEMGAPAIIVQPGAVYGRGDHSIVGQMISDAAAGRLRMKMFPETGFNLVYVDDVVDGILLAHDKGVVGESYVLGGEISTMGDLVDRAAALSGRPGPRLTLPPVLAKVSAPLGPLVGRLMGLPPNMRELIAASDGVTYWAKDDKARRELGYRPRSLDEGLRELFSLSTS